MPYTPLCPDPPTAADNKMASAVRKAHAAFREALTAAAQEGDFYFLIEHRIEALAVELSDIEQLFCDMYGMERWAAAVLEIESSNAAVR